MKNRHITRILDQTALNDLSQSDLAQIRRHADVCPDCRQSWRAAQTAAQMLRARGAEISEPPAFFESKIMAAIRERKTQHNPVAAFWRMWQSARAVIALMVVLVAALAGLTFVAPRMGDQPTERAGTIADYATEKVLFNRAADSPAELTAGQTLQAIYDADDDSAKK